MGLAKNPTILNSWPNADIRNAVAQQGGAGVVMREYLDRIDTKCRIEQIAK